MKPRLIILICIYLTSFYTTIKAQSKSHVIEIPSSGKYRIEHLDISSVFETNFYEVAQDPEGFMFIGSREQGILFFREKRWETFYRFPQITNIANYNDLLYFKSTHNFGFLKIKNRPILMNGKKVAKNNLESKKDVMQFLDSNSQPFFLKDHLPENDIPIHTIQKIIPYEKGAYFISPTHILHFLKASNKIDLIVNNEKGVTATLWYNELLIWEKGKGIYLPRWR